MILLDVKKQLEITEWGISEYPGYIVKFMGGQISIKRSGTDAKQRLNYSLLQRGTDVIMSAAPHLLDTPGELKVEMIKNHIKLTSTTNSDDHITLIKEKLL